jgi:hypothetical protein
MEVGERYRVLVLMSWRFVARRLMGRQWREKRGLVGPFEKVVLVLRFWFPRFRFWEKLKLRRILMSRA